MILQRIPLLGSILFGSLALVSPALCQTSSAIASNFNGTSITGDHYIWFNAHVTDLTFTGNALNTPEVKIFVTGQTVTFDKNNTTYVVDIPDAVMTFSNAAAGSSGSFTGGDWVTTFPKNGSDNPFISGTMWDVPAIGISGGTSSVTWTANFATDHDLLSKLSWQWSAAVYTAAPTDPNLLGVLFTDGPCQSGTPMNYRDFVIGGARGGGGSNFTGSNSATGEISDVAVIPEPASISLIVLGAGLACFRRKRA